MDRRDFIKKGSGVLATIPLIGWLFRTDAEPNTVTLDTSLAPVEKISEFNPFDSTKLNGQVKEAVKNLSTTDPNLMFISRTPVVHYLSDEELTGAIAESLVIPTSKFYTADLVANDQESPIYEMGLKPFSASAIPNIKIGSRIGQEYLSKIAQFQASPSGLQHIEDYQNTTAKSLVTGVYQRMNQLLVSYMVGGVQYDRYGLQIKLNNISAPDIHRKADWSGKYFPLASIRGHLRAVKNKYNVSYDRVTMTSTMFRAIIENCDNAKVRKEYKKGLSEARQALANILKLEIEVYDSTFKIRANDGSTQQESYLPTNVLLFSATKNDNNKDVFHFGNAITTESIVSNIFKTNAGNTGGVSVGPIGYYTTDPSLNPPDVSAWAVSRGLPVLKDAKAFSSLTVNLPLEV